MTTKGNNNAGDTQESADGASFNTAPDIQRPIRDVSIIVNGTPVVTTAACNRHHSHKSILISIIMNYKFFTLLKACYSQNIFISSPSFSGAVYSLLTPLCNITITSFK